MGAEIEFIISGKKQLMINNIRSSCPSCIRVEWKQHPIAAGGKGRIKVFFNPLDRPGKFFKTVTIESNAKQVYKFRVTGEVIPKTAESTESYSVKMGELNLQTKEKEYINISKEFFEMIPDKIERLSEVFAEKHLDVPIMKYYNMNTLFERIMMLNNEDVVLLKDLIAAREKRLKEASIILE